MTDVLMSIQPRWCGLIANGSKTLEIRKNRPAIETPFKVYIYCTKPSKKHQTICGCMVINDDELYRLPTGEVKYGCSLELMGDWSGQYSKDNFLNGKIIGEFICDKIARFDGEFWDDETYERLQEMYEPDDFNEYGEYEYTTIATNEDDDYKDNWVCKQSCVSWEELREYIGTGSHEFYGWHISHFKMYDAPKELSTLSTIDTVAVKKCEYRERVFNNPDLVNGAWLPGSFVCNKDELDWCSKCKTKQIIRPPQSWCYIESSVI